MAFPFCPRRAAGAPRDVLAAHVKIAARANHSLSKKVSTSAVSLLLLSVMSTIIIVRIVTCILEFYTARAKFSAAAYSHTQR